MSYEFKQSDVYDFAKSFSHEVRRKGDELEFRYCPYCRGGDHHDDWTFAVNLKSGAFKCLRASCEQQGHFVELRTTLYESAATVCRQARNEVELNAVKKLARRCSAALYIDGQRACDPPKKVRDKYETARETIQNMSVAN